MSSSSVIKTSQSTGSIPPPESISRKIVWRKAQFQQAILLTLPPLNTREWLTWSKEIKSLLKPTGLLELIEGDGLPCPRKEDDRASFDTWDDLNETLRSKLLQALNSTIKTKYIDYPTALEMWKALQEEFGAPSTDLAMDILFKITHSQFADSDDITEYINKLDKLFTQFESLRCGTGTFTDSEKIYILLRTLPESWSTWVTSIQARNKDNVSYREICNLASEHGDIHNKRYTAMAARVKGPYKQHSNSESNQDRQNKGSESNTNMPRSEILCYYCWKQGHMIKDCRNKVADENNGIYQPHRAMPHYLRIAVKPTAAPTTASPILNSHHQTGDKPQFNPVFSDPSNLPTRQTRPFFSNFAQIPVETSSNVQSSRPRPFFSNFACTTIDKPIPLSNEAHTRNFTRITIDKPIPLSKEVYTTRTWLADSGCNTFITNDKNAFKELKPLPQKVPVTFGNNNKFQAMHSGTISIQNSRGQIADINNVIYVPNAPYSLFSIGAGIDQGFIPRFSKNGGSITFKKGDFRIRSIRSDNRLYRF